MAEKKDQAYELGYRAGKEGEALSKYPTFANSKDKKVKASFLSGYLQWKKEGGK